MANDPVTSSEAPQPANVTPTGAGPGYNYLSGGLIVVLALYLVVMTGVALYAMIELWPHPTPAGALPPPADTTATGTTATDTTAADATKTDTTTTETSSEKKPPAAGKGEIPMPTAEEIAARQARLCGTTDKVESAAGDAGEAHRECRACVEREMQLQYESQRRYDPQCVRIFGCSIILWQEKRLLLLVLLAGAVGALLHSIRYLSWFVGSRTFRSSWTAFYYLSPFAGAAVAFVAYIVIRGGFFSSTSTTADTSPFMFVALAAIAGMFSREVLEKLKKIAESAFEPAPKTTDSGASAKPIAKPVITSLEPNSMTAKFTDRVKVNGSGFTKESKVHVGGTAIATTFVNDKQLTFVPPATSTAAPAKIDVIVVNAGGAASEAKQIEITP